MTAINNHYAPIPLHRSAPQVPALPQMPQDIPDIMGDPVFAAYAGACSAACGAMLDYSARARDRLAQAATDTGPDWKGLGATVDQGQLLRGQLQDAVAGMAKHAGYAEQRQESQVNDGDDWTHSEWYDMLAGLIGQVDQEWLSKYEDMLKKYAGMLTELAEIMAKIKVHADGEDSTVFDTEEASTLIYELMKKYEGAVFASFGSPAEAQAFLDGLGITGFVVSGNNIVMAKFGLLYDLSEHVPSGGKVDNAQYNAWLQGKDAIYEEIQNIGRNLAELNSRAMQRFDNMVKILSSSIDSISQADKNVISNLS